jgi:D-arabinose 1-dehydrogenase-like Zn-dependent alcohol dehydrogenase
VNTPNTSGSSAILLTAAPTTLKTITVTSIPAGSRVWLTGIVGWEATAGTSSIQLQILRGATVIFSTNAHAAANSAFATTNVNHVDTTPGTGSVTYSLIAVMLVGTGTAVGGITFTGSLINP